jgi:hypothetical protein
VTKPNTTYISSKENVSNTFSTKRTTKGFKKAASVLDSLTQKGFEKKGFSQSKLITSWTEIVGEQVSNVAKPLKITFPKSGLGATLEIEINGAFGPELALQLDILKEKINRVYGYTAVSRVTMKQSSVLGYNQDKKNLSESNNSQKNKHGSFKKILINEHTKGSISKLSDVKDENLRETLNKFCSAFLNKYE